MRKGLALGLAVVTAMLGMPVGAFAAAGSGNLQGVVKDATRQTLSGVQVRLRSVNGSIAAVGTTVAGGTFSFSGVAPGLHVVEVVDAAGKVVGTSAPISIAAGSTATVSVSAAAQGSIRAQSKGGLFGMGTTGTILVLGAAAALGTWAIIAATDDASPSK